MSGNCSVNKKCLHGFSILDEWWEFSCSFWLNCIHSNVGAVSRAPSCFVIICGNVSYKWVSAFCFYFTMWWSGTRSLFSNIFYFPSCSVFPFCFLPSLTGLDSVQYIVVEACNCTTFLALLECMSCYLYMFPLYIWIIYFICGMMSSPKKFKKNKRTLYYMWTSRFIHSLTHKCVLTCSCS